jgi:hypothetical protein
VDRILYEKLVALAESKTLAAYSDVAPLIGLDMAREADREEMTSKLAEIARFEHSNGRPMLTALVVHLGSDNNPGEGFFSIAKEFGMYGGSRNPIQRLTFWARQVQLVFGDR